MPPGPTWSLLPVVALRGSLAEGFLAMGTGSITLVPTWRLPRRPDHHFPFLQQILFHTCFLPGPGHSDMALSSNSPQAGGGGQERAGLAWDASKHSQMQETEGVGVLSQVQRQAGARQYQLDRLSPTGPAYLLGSGQA